MVIPFIAEPELPASRLWGADPTTQIGKTNGATGDHFVIKSIFETGLTGYWSPTPALYYC